MFQVGAIYYVVLALTSGEQTADAAWTALLLLAASVIGRAVINRFTQLQQTHAGYFMVANRRIEIGDKLKRIPMGYFNEKSLGEITGVATTVLDVVETSGPVVLVRLGFGGNLRAGGACQHFKRLNQRPGLYALRLRL